MKQLHIGTIAHVTKKPEFPGDGLEIVENGALVIDHGRVQAIGDKTTLQKQYPDAAVTDHNKAWLIPGMVDGHIHFPQYYATAGYGKDLLEWLEGTVFAAELRYADPTYATQAADRFVDHLLRCGTTTALVFGSQFEHATQALFETARKRGLRLITGLTLMDQGGPEPLLIKAEDTFEANERIIQWVSQESRLDYAVTPRFALSCSKAMMDVCHSLIKKWPDVYIQTHINEAHGEIKAVNDQFEADHYAAVYHDHGLLTDRTVLAHNIHASDAELNMISGQGCAVCHCPTSNSYLGSGLFPLKRHLDAGIPVCMGTDVGAGSQFSIIGELAETYKVQQLQGHTLDAAMLLYLGTLAGAEALKRQELGNFQQGKDADFIVLDPSRSAYLEARLSHAADPASALFALLQLADPHIVSQTWIGGALVSEAEREN